MGCPIRRPPGQRLFAPLRSLSQLATSFIACLCQGIHRVPLVASSHNLLQKSDSISFALHRCQRTARLPRMLYDGGDGRARTGDPRLAKPVLSQLSYTPICRYSSSSWSLVGLTRVELVTSRLSGVRSNQLSYRPKPEITLFRLYTVREKTSTAVAIRAQPGCAKGVAPPRHTLERR